MGGGGDGGPSGSRPRRGGPAGRTRSRRLPTPARTPPPPPPPPGGARCTSAACRTGCPRRGCAPPASADRPGSVLACRGGDLAGHAPLGQHLAAGLVVVAGVQVHHRPGGQHPNHRAGGCEGVEGGCQQSVVAVVGGGGDRAQRDAVRVSDQRAFPACLRRSTGLGPATCPPQGALVMQPSTARWARSNPNSRW
jgi:hypothetical protein